MSLALRRAHADDCALVFDWGNDPTTRAMSFSTAAIDWAEHQSWFHTRLADTDGLFFIGEVEGAPVGVVRFVRDGDADAATISINVAPDQRGRGYGTALVRAGLYQVIEKQFAGAVDALVKPGNEASLRLFSGVGFGERVVITHAGQQAVRMTRRL